MKVLDLQCAHQHGFEGWFASEDDYAGQLARGLLSCPLCGDTHIQKMLSAPRLNLRAGRESTALAAPEAPASAPRPSGGAAELPAPSLQHQAQWLQAMRQVLANTEDVGERFADQARAMHHGDAEPRRIRGHATPQVAMELLEEGIEVLPLPVVPALKETLQ